jgi:hypothetical protein
VRGVSSSAEHVGQEAVVDNAGHRPRESEDRLGRLGSRP